MYAYLLFSSVVHFQYRSSSPHVIDKVFAYKTKLLILLSSTRYFCVHIKQFKMISIYFIYTYKHRGMTIRRNVPSGYCSRKLPRTADRRTSDSRTCQYVGKHLGQFHGSCKEAEATSSLTIWQLLQETDLTDDDDLWKPCSRIYSWLRSVLSI